MHAALFLQQWIQQVGCWCAQPYTCTLCLGLRSFWDDRVTCFSVFLSQQQKGVKKRNSLYSRSSFYPTSAIKATPALCSSGEWSQSSSASPSLEVSPLSSWSSAWQTIAPLLNPELHHIQCMVTSIKSACKQSVWPLCPSPHLPVYWKASHLSSRLFYTRRHLVLILRAIYQRTLKDTCERKSDPTFSQWLLVMLAASQMHGWNLLMSFVKLPSGGE